MNSLYAPILPSTMIPIINTGQTFIHFEIPSQLDVSLIQNGCLQVSVIQQANNKNIVNAQRFPDKIIYLKPHSTDQHQVDYGEDPYFKLIPSYLNVGNNFQSNVILKIQIRFCMVDIDEDILSDANALAAWKNQRIENDEFSEWSNVMLIKFIDRPEIEIKNKDKYDDMLINGNNSATTIYYETTFQPIFQASYNPGRNSEEVLSKYKFDIYEGIYTKNNVQNAEPILTSGWKDHQVTNQEPSIDSYRFPYQFTDLQSYTLLYSTRTINNYEISVTKNNIAEYGSALYHFVSNRAAAAVPESLYSLVAFTGDQYCQENGVIKLLLTSNGSFTGNYVISRTSEKSNFLDYEDIWHGQGTAKTFNNDLIFTDFTVESGIRYKYALQIEYIDDQRSQPLITDEISIDLEYSYLYRDGIQLRLEFNQQVSSFKHTVSRNKQDTIGSKFPYLAANGNAYYAEFPITGLISIYMDEDNTFFKRKEYANSTWYFYKDEPVFQINKKMYPTSGKRNSSGAATDLDQYTIITTDETKNNIFVERKFREKVEEFLNDFEIKLYRSPTEGNIIVNLMNISLTPNQTLGRMLFTFTATAYEIMDYDLDTMAEYGIIDKGERISINSVKENFGQSTWDIAAEGGRPFNQTEIGGKAYFNIGLFNSTNPINSTKKFLYSSNLEIGKNIIFQEETSVGENYRYWLLEVYDLWIESFPSFDYENVKNKNYIEILKQVEEFDTDTINKIQAKNIRYKRLEKALEQTSNTGTILSLNGNPIFIPYGKIYHIHQTISRKNLKTLTLVQGGPILVNYKCRCSTIPKEKRSRVDVLIPIWSQLAGIFIPEPNNIIDFYKIRYSNNASDFTGYNYYTTLNIKDLILEDAKKQADKLIRKSDNYDYTYEIANINRIDLEATQGTSFYLFNGETEEKKVIGVSEKYRIVPDDTLQSRGEVRAIFANNFNLRLARPQFAIVNYSGEIKVSRIGGVINGEI